MIYAKRPRADDLANYSYVAELRESVGENRPALLASNVEISYGSYCAKLIDSDTAPAPDFGAPDQLPLSQNAEYLSRARFRQMRSQILKSTDQKKCPYCYLNRASEIDHYLPKSMFGEYAIYSLNLVPICRICNGKKLNKYTRPDGGRKYLHPYFDRVPPATVRFLEATISVDPSVSISFHIVKPPDVNEEMWEILRAHFQDLELDVRYMEESVESMLSMLGSIYIHHATGGKDDVVKYLRIEQASKESLYGYNHWWPAMLNALANADSFCDGGFMKLGPAPAM